MQPRDGRVVDHLKARAVVTAHQPPAAGRAKRSMKATVHLTAPTPDLIGQIRIAYRMAKSTEDTRNRLFAGVTAFVRTYASGWTPTDDAAERKRTAKAARRVVKQVLRRDRPLVDGKPAAPYPEVLDKDDPMPGDAELLETVRSMVEAIAGPWWRFEIERHGHRKRAEELIETLPGWQRIKHVSGFSSWGLVALIGEAGDLSDYSGCRQLFKQLGLAPDDCYPTGDRRTGRKIPRATRGRIIGIICDPLLRQQWRGERADDGGCLTAGESLAASDPTVVPAHAIGPFGAVYGEAKARHLAAGKSKGHAEKLARRSMVKALIHDVHLAWHDRPLDYATAVPEAA